MSSKLFKPLNKVMGAIGLVEDDDEEVMNNDEYNENEDDYTYDYEEAEKLTNSGKHNKVVSIKSSSAPKVILKKPLDLKGSMEIIDAIRAKRIVVMNLVDIDSKGAQRIIDCVVGSCYALDASFQQIAKSVYLIAPENVSVTNELKEAINKDDDFFSYE